MRKIIVSMNMSLDGFMSGPDCELGWHFAYWNAEMADSFCEELSRAGTILFGRITYHAMAQHGREQAADLSAGRGDIAFTELMNGMPKLVCSHHPQILSWQNSRLLLGDAVDQISALKGDAGKDIVVYGSGQLIEALARHDLIDAYNLWIHPVVLGRGKRLFRNEKQSANLRLKSVTPFHSGVMMTRYEVLHPPCETRAGGTQKRMVKKAQAG